MGFTEDISMLKYFLTAIAENKGYDTMIGIMIFPEVIETNKDRNDTCRKIHDGINRDLMNNFITGYIIAVKKYGIDDANERMKEKLIETILKYQPWYTRESLLEEVSNANKYANKMAGLSDVMKNGIHLYQTEDGKYEYE